MTYIGTRSKTVPSFLISPTRLSSYTSSAS